MKQQKRPVNDGILVLDYGSQYTLLIARRLREIGIYSEVIDGRSPKPPEGFVFHGLILGGGPDTVTDIDARQLPAWVIASQKPILGICYGMHLLMHTLGGKLRSGEGREYGRALMRLSPEMHEPAAAMFYDLPTEQTVWMSHGVDVTQLAPGFNCIGKTEDGIIAAVVDEKRPYIGLQFHPEVQHTEFGSLLLKQFVLNVCRAKLNWQPGGMLDATIAQIRATVGQGQVLMAVSGGVDSSVAAALLVKALGPERVTGVFVDHGLLRHREAEWVTANLHGLGLRHLEVIHAGERFLNKLSGVTDPETKRKIIGRTFIEEFERFAATHRDFTHLGQGTLYPDVIESAGHGAGAKVIKSHHNVGGLPDVLKLPLIEPFRYLFKDEVRRLGAEIGVQKTLLERHPFPGPGLAVRILGAITSEQVQILQAADHIFIEALHRHKLYQNVWQAFAVLLPVKSVGVMGDNRTYQQTVALRAVSASDGMTASVGMLPLEFLVGVGDQIVRNVPGVNRVVYDITSKPPATIEWE